ncbi:MAG: superoxide dismutase family protein [Acidobacteriota bacterium]
MKTKTFLTTICTIWLGLSCAPAPPEDEPAGQAPAAPGTPVPAAPAAPAMAQAVLAPLGDSGVSGKVVFTETQQGVKVGAHVSGLTPGAHGFHIHEIGDCSSSDGKSAGGHFNPLGVPHAGPDADQAQAGDLGNITADASGQAELSMVSSRITLGEGPTGIAGRAVILHAQADDLTSQPTGAAGGRVACGVIGEIP